jgi:hypothetical protein
MFCCCHSLLLRPPWCAWSRVLDWCLCCNPLCYHASLQRNELRITVITLMDIMTVRSNLHQNNDYSWDYGHRYAPRWSDTLYPQKLALTSPTSGGRWVFSIADPVHRVVFSFTNNFTPVNYFLDQDFSFYINSRAWVRERTILTERLPLVGEVSANFYGWRDFAWSAWRIHTAVFSVF